jgi:hypothetical protein
VKLLNTNGQDISKSNFPKLEQCCGDLFKEDIKAGLFPLIAGWAGSDALAATWLKNEKIPAFGGKTGLEICQNNQVAVFLIYIQHIEHEGFA